MANYFNYNENKYGNILIFGFSDSGKSVKKVLDKFGIDYMVYDDKSNVIDKNHIKVLNKKTLSQFDLIVLSPGVSIYHKKIMLADSLGIKVISEIEFASLFCKVPIIAVTGTNGKTTTVGLITHLLNSFGKKAIAMGNIGLPFSEIIEYDDLDYVVLEVSSFHLESTNLLRPHIAVLLNIDEDHIDRHKSFRNYINCKLNLFKKMQDSDYAILNADDKILCKNLDYINGNKIFVSENKRLDYFIKDNHLFKLSKKKSGYVQEVILYPNELKLCNTFMTNILAVCAVIDKLGISFSNFEEHIKSFNWYEHRFEYVLTKMGVDFINDSKSTNIHSTKFAIQKSEKDIVLMLGGQNKNLNFDEFFKNLSVKVVAVVCFGQAGKLIYKSALKNKIQLVLYEKDLELATRIAYKTARIGEMVLFSPACASFDAFKGYKHRGQMFVSYVKELAE